MLVDRTLLLRHFIVGLLAFGLINQPIVHIPYLHYQFERDCWVFHHLQSIQFILVFEVLLPCFGNGQLLLLLFIAAKYLLDVTLENINDVI